MVVFGFIMISFSGSSCIPGIPQSEQGIRFHFFNVQIELVSLTAHCCVNCGVVRLDLSDEQNGTSIL
jgi:hypothetical protein